MLTFFVFIRNGVVRNHVLSCKEYYRSKKSFISTIWWFSSYKRLGTLSGHSRHHHKCKLQICLKIFVMHTKTWRVNCYHYLVFRSCFWVVVTWGMSCLLALNWLLLIQSWLPTSVTRLNLLLPETFSLLTSCLKRTLILASQKTCNIFGMCGMDINGMIWPGGGLSKTWRASWLTGAGTILL